MMSNKRVITKEATQTDDVYAGVGTYRYGDDISIDDQQMLEAIQRKLGGMSAVGGNTVNESADTMPSQLSMTFNRNYASQSAAASKSSVSAKSSTSTSSELSTRTKVAIAAYVAAVLVLVLAISLCSVAIGKSFGAVALQQQTYGETVSQYEALREEVNAGNYDELYQKATEMGFVEVDSGNSYHYDELESRPAQNFNVETNWFDQLCDWLCGVFGG